MVKKEEVGAATWIYMEHIRLMYLFMELFAQPKIVFSFFTILHILHISIPEKWWDEIWAALLFFVKPSKKTVRTAGSQNGIPFWDKKENRPSNCIDRKWKPVAF